MLYSKHKGKDTSQDNQDKETSTEKVQRENKRRNSGGGGNPGKDKNFFSFFVFLTSVPAVWPTQLAVKWVPARGLSSWIVKLTSDLPLIST
jgi:hypothetical protein